MIETSFSILFYLKKPKGYAKGEALMYMRITANGASKEIATKQACDPERWNGDGQRSRGTNEKTRTLNAFLDALERKVHEARLRLWEGNTHITAEGIKNMLTGKGEKPRMLLKIFQYHGRRRAVCGKVRK